MPSLSFCQTILASEFFHNLNCPTIAKMYGDMIDLSSCLNNLFLCNMLLLLYGFLYLLAAYFYLYLTYNSYHSAAARHCLFIVYAVLQTVCNYCKLYLSHQTRVLNTSGPITAIAAFTLSVLTDNSEVGYPILLINVPLGTSGLLGWP